MEVTFFNSIFSDTPQYVKATDMLDRIKNGKWEDLAYNVRVAKDKDAKTIAKKKLPAICWSGKFPTRYDDKCIKHSGLVCLDFDGFEDIDSLNNFKGLVCADNHTFAAFISPSGLGLKVLVKIPTELDNHKGYFRALHEYYDTPYFDTTSKNPSRVCFATYDPDTYINHDSLLWEIYADEEVIQAHTPATAIVPITDNSEVVRRLLKWHKDKFPMVTGQRNHNAYVLASALNEYGVPQHEAVTVISSNYQMEGFGLAEIETTVRSAYKNAAAFGTKVFENTEVIKQVKHQIKQGDQQAAQAILKSHQVVDTAKAVESLTTTQSNEWEFWVFNPDTNRYTIDEMEFFSFLQCNGFYKFYPDKENPESILFVEVHNNLVKPTSVYKIKDFVLKYLKDKDRGLPFGLVNYFLRNPKFFKQDYLTNLESIELKFLKETKDTAYIYYSNCIVKVTPDNIETISYIDVDGYIWQGNLLDREYTPSDTDATFDFNQFIKNIGNESRLESMQSAIGYLLHNYKPRGYCPAVVLNDEVISDNPEGGTGKGLFCSAISKMRRAATIDGKNFDLNKTFAFQTVSLDTQVLVFDDIKKHFDFEGFFSIITEGMTVERKNKDAITIPFEDAPKIVFTTNYAIKGSGNSFARRKFDLEFCQFYNKDFTPEDEFGRLLFEDWDSVDWSKFDAYMINCLQSYLTTGLVEADLNNLKVRTLGAATSHEFIEWMGLTKDGDKVQRITLGQRVLINDLMHAFTTDYPDYAERSKFSLSRIRFKRWVDAYIKFLGKGEINRASNGNYVYIEEN